ncbi:neuronal acetylcholine receptor subunit alpha-5-like [Topomyia yanbarensis]|uniref:neuronal acetylcholine receptor subunit alpha-5-like n=1 Tax=Topomyia yanbarensis TaxID=2498891 RepID=UPI00273C2CA7|nr:neuronal acetylcholine receptor subunit alpha-5-like [Topomyia yanbarensis]
MHKFCVAVIFVIVVNLGECINCDRDSTHEEIRLKKQLLCGSYNSDLRPVKDFKFSINVSITPVLMSYDFNDSEDTLDTNTLLIMQWTDEFLKWDPKTFSNITSIVISTDELWTPDLQLFSSYYKPDAKTSCTNPRCLVKSDGLVICVPSCDFNARCNSDYSNWPLDSQRCHMYYGAWMESSSEVDFHSSVSWLGSSQTNAHIQWRVVSAKVSREPLKSKDNQTYPVLIYDYVIERHSSFHLAALLTPILLLIALNLFLTWLSTDSVERKLLLAVSIFCHFKFMTLLQWAVPFNGETVPGILIFFRNSMIITCLLIIHTMVGAAMKRMDREPPNLVVLLTGTVVKNKFGELILAGNYMNVEYKQSESNQAVASETSENSTVWLSFSKTLDRLLFIAFFTTYAVFFFIYVPLKYARLGKYELNIMDYEDINQID